MLPITMPKISPAIFLPAAGLIAFAAALIGTVLQSVPIINASPDEQAAISLSVDDCTEVEEGDLFQLEFRVSGVQDLLAWEVYFAFDRNLIEVIDRDVRMFLSEGPNSSVVDFSDTVPNSTGIYRLAAADVALGATAESGAGVLGTLILRARAEGVSPAAIFRDDIDGNGTTDLGPTLTATGGGTIDDANGDNIFDGDVQSGQIAIGKSCLSPPPTANPKDIVIVIQPTSPTAVPGASTTSTATPTGDNPGSNGGGESPTGPSNATSGDADTIQTSTATPTGIGGGPNDEPDSSSGAIAWIIGGIGAALALGLVVSYVVVRTTQKRV